MTHIILPCTADDIQILTDFQRKMALETEGLELEEKEVSEGIQAVIEDPHKGIYYKVIKDSEVIGCMMNTLEWSDWRNGYFIYIQSLYVVPEYRKQGVFQDLFNFVRKKVIGSEAYKGIRLYVDRSNQTALEAYHRVGLDDSHYRFFEWIKRNETG